MDKENMDIYKGFVRELSLSRIRTCSFRDDFVIKELEQPNATVHAHWVASILISGKAMRITFKGHFMGLEVKNLVALKNTATPDEIPINKAKDFVKEFCNLVAGHMKIQFESKDINIGFSLPLVTNGVDELFYLSPNGKNVFKDAWTLSCNENKIVCTVLTEVIDPKIVDKIKFADFVVDYEDDGEFDLL